MLKTIISDNVFSVKDLDFLLLPFHQKEPIFDLPEALGETVQGLKERLQDPDCSSFQLSFYQGEQECYHCLAFDSGWDEGLSPIESLKTQFAKAISFCHSQGAKRIGVVLDRSPFPVLASGLVESLGIASHPWQRKKSKVDLWDLEVYFQGLDESSLKATEELLSGINLARELTAETPDVLTPSHLIAQLETIAKEHGCNFGAWSGIEELEEGGYVGHCRVGAASEHPPAMAYATYEPEGGASEDLHLVLVGKGVTFDTGGLSLKPAASMPGMIADMAGAAAVVGAFKTLCARGSSIKVTAIVVSAENSVGSTGYRPGDILTYKNGKTVMVGNTDAEGRLLLADGLLLAQELGATHIVDIATLTGACMRALGLSFSGLMGTSRKLINAISRSGAVLGEMYWKLPLPAEYKAMLKCPQADLKNIGEANAGAQTAGLFLQEFVDSKVEWAHLDITAPWREKPWKYYPEGPTGLGVKTLSNLVVDWQRYYV